MPRGAVTPPPPPPSPPEPSQLAACLSLPGGRRLAARLRPTCLRPLCALCVCRPCPAAFFPPHQTLTCPPPRHTCPPAAGVVARVTKVDTAGGKLSLGLKPSYFEDVRWGWESVGLGVGWGEWVWDGVSGCHNGGAEKGERALKRTGACARSDL